MWLFATVLAASAGDLTWRWDPAVPVRYHAEALVGTPLGQRFYGTANKDARALQTGLALDVTCTGEDAGKYFKVRCAIDKAAIEGVAFSGEQDKLNAVFGEYTELLRGASVQLEAREDGHVRQLDLEGVARKDARWAVVHESMRQLMRRAFAPLSVQLPKDGVDPGKPWKHKGVPLAFELFSESGTTGGMTYEYEAAGRAGETVLVHGSGRGNVATQAQLDASSNVGVNLVVAGQARFDPAAGNLAYSEVSTTGMAGAASMTVGAAERYVYAGWMGRINAGGSVETREGAPPAPPPEAPPEAVPPAPAAPDEHEGDEADG